MESVPKKNLERLSEVAGKAAENLGLVLLHLTARGTPSRAIIEVTLDGEKLVSIEDCQTVSRKLDEAIEGESIVSGNYRLDVLSPGLDEPLLHDYQFKRTVSRLVEVSFQEGDKKQSVTGTLNDITDRELLITKRQTKRGKKDEKGEEVHIQRSQILTAFARPDFG